MTHEMHLSLTCPPPKDQPLLFLQLSLAPKPNVLQLLPSERRSPNIPCTIRVSSASCKRFLFQSCNCLLVGIKCEVFWEALREAEWIEALLC